MFPMKVDRKKAREELDIVNVVEWRHRTGSQDRWFLLVKRPEGGNNVFPTSDELSMTGHMLIKNISRLNRFVSRPP